MRTQNSLFSRSLFAYQSAIKELVAPYLRFWYMWNRRGSRKANLLALAFLVERWARLSLDSLYVDYV